MPQTPNSFVELALSLDALRFGEFTLKSGRVSPYFFNAGQLAGGRAAAALGKLYAAVIAEQFPTADVLFGPAYKGIPLAALAAAALAEHKDIDLPYAFNRKEAKDHGEGGNIVGGPLAGDVVIIDDVITAGTAIRESVEIIRAAGARVAGIVILLDRQERGTGELSAVQEVEQSLGVKVRAVATLEALVTHVKQGGDAEKLRALLDYRARYGIAEQGI
ncbi:MAG: orotate phosphoribosyltransferase [Pseudomonadota bacterium]